MAATATAGVCARASAPRPSRGIRAAAAALSRWGASQPGHCHGSCGGGGTVVAAAAVVVVAAAAVAAATAVATAAVSVTTVAAGGLAFSGLKFLLPSTPQPPLHSLPPLLEEVGVYQPQGTEHRAS